MGARAPRCYAGFVVAEWFVVAEGFVVTERFVVAEGFVVAERFARRETLRLLPRSFMVGACSLRFL